MSEETLTVELPAEEVTTEETQSPNPAEQEGQRKVEDPREVVIQKQNKKIDFFYGKMKENEEKALAHEKELAALRERLEVMDELKEHTRLLQEAAERTLKEKDKAGAITDTSDIDSQIVKLKAEKKAARADYDFDKADDIQEMIDELKEKKLELKALGGKPKNVDAPAMQQAPVSKDLVVAFDAFKEEAKWFNTNQSMAKYAIGVDNMLMNDPDWENKSYKERFAEVKRRTEERFDYGQKDTGVESGSKGNKGTGKSITLSKDQIAIAAKFGISPEDYAKQLAIINGGKN